MAKAKEQETFPKDTPEELAKMLEYYSERFSEVYWVRDLKVDAVVAVELYPASPQYPEVTRNGKKMSMIGYKERLFSSRERFDNTGTGKKMIGYESAYGTDTRIGDMEEGIVAKKVATSVNVMYESMGGYSPYEKHQQQTAVEAKQTSATGYTPDYELKTKEDGLTYERFEDFAIDRVK